MDTHVVPIDWGLQVIVAETLYDQIEKRLFPHAEKHFQGGTCLSDGVDKAQIYVCPQCESAKSSWLNQMAIETMERTKK